MTTLVKVEPIWTPESQQTIFRGLLNALSFPGRIQDLSAPLGGAQATSGALASVVDERVTVADPQNLLSAAERRLLAPGAFVDAPEADYVVVDGASAPASDFRPNIGTIYRPENAAMVFVRVGKIGSSAGLRVTLTGPGVESEQSFEVAGLHPEWLIARNRWCDNFPTGCDLILCDETGIVGIPRTSALTFIPSEEESR